LFTHLLTRLHICLLVYTFANSFTHLLITNSNSRIFGQVTEHFFSLAVLQPGPSKSLNKKRKVGGISESNRTARIPASKCLICQWVVLNSMAL